MDQAARTVVASFVHGLNSLGSASYAHRPCRRYDPLLLSSTFNLGGVLKSELG